jgi:hypothetical protein
MKNKLQKMLAVLLCIAALVVTCDAGSITTSAASGTLVTYSGHQQSYGSLSKVSDCARHHRQINTTGGYHYPERFCT